MGLLDLQPTVVSKDLRSKIIMFYGAPKSGKTTMASKFPKALIAATEIGTNALNGVYVVPIKKWAGKIKKTKKDKDGNTVPNGETAMSFTEFLGELEDPAVKERYETIVVDTADILYMLAEDYVKSNNGVTKIKDIEWGQGYKEAEEIFDKALRQIPLMGYGLVIISHSEDKTLKNAAGEEYQQIQPTLPKKPQRIVNRMADIIGYSATITNEDGDDETRLIMRGNQRVIAGSRWKHTPNSIVFSYDNLVEAIHDAVEAAAEEDGVTPIEEQANLYESAEFDFDTVLAEIIELGKGFHAAGRLEEFTEVMEDTFGEGMKTGDLEKEHTEAIAAAIAELTEIFEAEEEETEEEETAV